MKTIMRRCAIPGICPNTSRLGRVEYEVDFVVNRGSKRVYIQSAFEMSGLEKIDAEKRSLKKTGDYFRKIIVKGGNERMAEDEDGVVTVGVIPFLLDSEIVGL